MRWLRWITFLAILLSSTSVLAQVNDLPKPGGAFWRSLVMPGWGHYYAEGSDSRAARRYLVADVTFLATYLGLNQYSSNLSTNLNSFALQNAGVDLSRRDRSYVLAVTNYNSIDEYNDAQLRLRNWDSLIPETEENYWSWGSEKERINYVDLRDRRDRIEQQIPLMVTLMVGNRLLASLQAYRRAKIKSENASTLSVNGWAVPDGWGVSLRIGF